MSFRGFLARERFGRLFEILHRLGAQCIGPSVNEGTIRYTRLTGPEQFPHHVCDSQKPGHYRLLGSDSARWFAWSNGAQALKPLTFVSRETLWHSRRKPTGEMTFSASKPGTTLTAVIGARACDLAAMALQDKHFKGDDSYSARRRQLILIAVNCTHPSAVCFCHSTGDGPEASTGYDLLLDELEEGFAVRCAGATGEAIVGQLALEPLQRSQIDSIAQANRQAAAAQHRKLPDIPLVEVLNQMQESSHWQAVADRCLSCGNCTSVCPSCFCHSQHDEPSADGLSCDHVREWDSCFTQGHSYIHGLVIRNETRFRYRQWLTHKFAGWITQYGRSGCVGCGRCISWCPVGIDVTEELHALAAEYRHD